MKAESPGKQLQTLIRKGGIILPGAFNALSAQLIEQAEFKAVYIPGAGLANGFAGLPDIGLLSLTEVITQVKYITDILTIPTIADADTGFGNGVHFLRAMAAFESAGVAAIQIEDQAFPKRCGHLSGKQLLSIREMGEKIRAATKARLDPDLMVIARCDARGVTNFQDTVDRARHYIDAGADMIFPEALQSKTEFSEFAHMVKGPLLANMTEFGLSPGLSASTLFEMGYSIVLFPMSLFRIAAEAMTKALEQIKKEGSTRDILSQMQTRKALYQLIRYEEYARLDDKHKG